MRKLLLRFSVCFAALFFFLQAGGSVRADALVAAAFLRAGDGFAAFGEVEFNGMMDVAPMNGSNLGGNTDTLAALGITDASQLSNLRFVISSNVGTSTDPAQSLTARLDVRFAGSNGSLTITTPTVTLSQGSPSVELALTPSQLTQLQAIFSADLRIAELNLPATSDSNLVFGSLADLTVSGRVTAAASPVPEPATLTLFGVGVAAATAAARRRKRGARGGQ